jgi:hypothetical protein
MAKRWVLVVALFGKILKMVKFIFFSAHEQHSSERGPMELFWFWETLIEKCAPWDDGGGGGERLRKGIF